MSWSGRVSNSRCSHEATERQIESGVKNGRHVRPIGHDALHPAGAVGDDLAAAQVAVGHGLAQQRPQQVVDVDGIRGQAAVDEELGGLLGRHAPCRVVPTVRGARAGGAVVRDRRCAGGDRARPIIATMIIAVDIGNSAVKAALVEGAVHAAGAPRDRARRPRRRPRRGPARAGRTGAGAAGGPASS